MRFAAGLSAVLLASAVSPAMAQSADEPIDWNGPYIGGSVGYNWVGKSSNETIRFDSNRDGTFGDTVTTVAGADAFSPGYCGGAALSNAPGGGCRKDKGGLDWAGHVGYDRLINGNFLVGVVLEGGKTKLRDSVSAYSTTPASYTMSRSLDWNAAARLRIGAPITSHTLLYGTGGVAYGKVQNSFSTTNTFNTFTQTKAKEDAWGWTAGAGIEQRISQAFSVGVLYKYTAYDADGYRVNAGQGTPASTTNPFVRPGATAGSTDFARGGARLDTHSVMGTASFHF